MKNDALPHIIVATLYLPAGMRAKKADAANPGKSSREVAAAASVSQRTVVRERQAGDADASPQKIVGRDGKPYPAQHAPSRALSLRLRVAIDVAAVLVAALIAVALVGRP